MHSVTSNAVALIFEKKRIYSWNLIIPAQTKMYIHPDVDTGGDNSRWVKITISTNFSFGDNIGVSEYLVRLNYTPYNGVNYRGLYCKLVCGSVSGNNTLNWDILAETNSSIDWDGIGIFIQNGSPYYRFNTTVESLYNP